MPQFAIFGKAGFLMTDQETRGASVRKRDDTENLKVELLSLGAEYRF